MKKKVIISDVKAIEATQSQVVVKGVPKSDDPNFPVWTVVPDKKFLVYIPTHWDEEADGVKVFSPLVSHQHVVKIKDMAKQVRCVNGLTDDMIGMELGLDGSCPYCNAVSECWESVNTKFEKSMLEMGRSPETADKKDDPVVKGVWDALRAEMPISGTVKYVTFPVVLISENGLFPAKDSKVELQTYFLTVSADSIYADKIMKAFESGYSKSWTKISGMFMEIDYNYSHQGQGKAMDAARKASFSFIKDSDAIKELSWIIPYAEESAKPFTKVEALNHLTALQFSYMSDIEADVDLAMRSVRAFNSLMAEQKALGGSVQSATPQIAPNVQNALRSFGVTDSGNSTQTAQTQSQSAPNAQNAGGIFPKAPINLG